MLVAILGGFAAGTACLPPATLTTSPTVAELPAEPPPEPSSCRVLLGEVDEAGRYSTRELRWGPTGEIEERRREGLVLGDGESLFEITLERRVEDASELYGDAPVRCEVDTVMRRRLPDGVSRPLLVGRSACVGTVDGQALEIDASVELLSGLGPFLGYRDRFEQRAPTRSSRLRYATIDVDDATPLDADTWLREPSPTMVAAAEGSAKGCARDAPSSTADVSGFALRWADPRGPRLLVGYSCCGGRICELDDPLPALGSELAALLPDPDRLLHSPHGCGSLGLDGRLRTRDGEIVGQVSLELERLIGVVFLASDHAFDIAW